MSNPSQFKAMLSKINTGVKYPALSAVKKEPELAAMLSKLIRSKLPKPNSMQSTAGFNTLTESGFSSISDRIKDNIEDIKNTQDLFPEIELAAQILISSILSPKDMVNTTLLYQAQVPLIPSAVIAALIEEVKSVCERDYALSKTLPEILRTALFETGSYITAILPESAVDELINGNKFIVTEALSELMTPDKQPVSLGFLGTPVPRAHSESSHLALEAFSNSTPTPRNTTPNSIVTFDTSGKVDKQTLGVEVSDNYKLLKLPFLITQNQKLRVASCLSRAGIGVTMEAHAGVAKIERRLYKDSDAKNTPIVFAKTNEQTYRKSIGRPLVLQLPSESVIPVSIPGNEKTHIGYFVIVDEEGNPVSKSTNLTYMTNLQGNLSNTRTNALSGFLLQRSRQNLVGRNDLDLTVPEATAIYSEIIETDLLERLKNGIYNRKVTFSRNNEIYRIMLARSLANQFTRMVFIPAELVSYFAFKYHDSGVGKSLLDNLKILTSLRAILLFSKVMALTKNAIALTHVNMTLSPDDPDPQRTIEVAIHEIIKTRQQYFPLGINSPVDLIDWVQRAGYEFSFEGHPRIPETKFEFQTKNSDHAIPDSDLDELLRKQTIMALGLNPELVENGLNNPEFATTVIQNNLLLSKRVTVLQDAFTPQLTNYVRIINTNDATLKTRLLTILQEHQEELLQLLSEADRKRATENLPSYFLSLHATFVDALKLELPKPDITTIQNQTAAYTEYAESLDKTLEAWLNSEFLSSELVGDFNNTVDAIKNTIKAYFLRNWQAENGFMPELNDITATAEGGGPKLDLYEIMKMHNDGILAGASRFIASLKTPREENDQKLEASGLDPNAAPAESTSEEGGGEDEGDAFGFGDETDITEETPPDEGEPESSEPPKEDEAAKEKEPEEAPEDEKK